MRNRSLTLGMGVILILVSATVGFSQAQATQNRIPQQVIINGQSVTAAYVTTPSGGIQSFTCSTPQQYVTPDGATQGWACYEQATGVWLLNALPPAQAQAQPAPAPAPLPAPQQPTVIYQQPAPTVVYTAPIYRAPAYPVVVAPAYPPSVVIGAAAINAFGRIASAAIVGSHYSRPYYVRGYGYPLVRGHRR